MIEKTIGGRGCPPQYCRRRTHFAELFRALPTPSPLSRLLQLKSLVEQEFAQIKHVLHGISLLGQCPDSVNAALISPRRKLSIAIMAGLLEARHKVSQPVENCSPWSPSESTVDIAESTRRIAASQIPADHDPDGRVYRQ